MNVSTDEEAADELLLKSMLDEQFPLHKPKRRGFDVFRMEKQNARLIKA